MSTVISVSVKKQGVGKKGPWTMYEAILDGGTKASGFDAVQPGDTVTVEQKGQYLNYSKTNGSGAQSTQAPRSNARSNSGSDDRSNRIERQHSQEMALRYCALTDERSQLNTSELRELIDWFQRDVGRMPAENPLQPAEEDGTDDEPPF